MDSWRICIDDNQSPKTMVEGKNAQWGNNDNINPLEIPTIVGNGIIPYLPFRDLLVCRRVCTLWADEGIKLLAKRGYFYLTEGENIHEFLEHLKKSNSSKITNLKSLQSLNLKLITSNDSCSKNGEINLLLKEIGNQLKFVQLNNSTTSFTEDFWKFFNSYAPSIKSLSLINVSIHQEISNTFLEDTTVKFEKLKHFSLVYEKLDCKSEEHYLKMKTFIVQMFKIMPNLERFSCNDKNCSEFILNALFHTADVNKITRKLNHLDMELNLNEEEIRKFHEILQYPLESLKFSLRPGLRFAGIYTFISTLGATLKILDLDFILIPPTTEKFPCGRQLVNLKELSFKNYYGSLDFIHDTKNLESLSLKNVNLSVAFREESGFDFDTSHGLKSLEIYSGHSNAGRFSFPHIFRKITKLFPQLKKFRMDYLSDSSLKIIAEGCTDLEELILPKAICTDVGVTGLSSSSINNMLQLLNSKDLTKELLLQVVRNNDKTESVQPSIATLKRLRKLHIQSPKMSNASLWLGVFSCKELRELCLRTPLITEAVLKSVAEKMQLQSLQLDECYQITSVGLNDLKDIMKHTSGNSVLKCSAMSCTICDIPEYD